MTSENVTQLTDSYFGPLKIIVRPGKIFLEKELFFLEKDYKSGYLVAVI